MAQLFKAPEQLALDMRLLCTDSRAIHKDAMELLFIWTDSSPKATHPLILSHVAIFFTILFLS